MNLISQSNYFHFINLNLHLFVNPQSEYNKPSIAMSNSRTIPEQSVRSAIQNPTATAFAKDRQSNDPLNLVALTRILEAWHFTTVRCLKRRLTGVGIINVLSSFANENLIEIGSLG